MAARRQGVAGVAARPDRLSPGRCRHARALAHRGDAQPGADGGGVLPGQASPDRLARGRAMVLGHAGRCRPRQQSRQLAVGGRLRRRCRALFPGVQSDPAVARSSTPTAAMSGAGCRSWRHLPNDAIHQPWNATPLELAGAGVKLGASYPQPIVDHKLGRERALAAYAKVRARMSAPRRPLYTSANPAIVAASTTLGDDMDDDKPILEQVTDAVSSAATATAEAAKTAVKKVKKAAKKAKKAVKKAVTKAPKKKAKKAKKAGKKSAVKKSAKKAGKKTAKKPPRKPRRKPPRRKRRPRSRSADRSTRRAQKPSGASPEAFVFATLPIRPQRAPVDQKHRGGAGDHADDGDGIEPLVEQHIGHDRGHRGHQIEQARHRGRRRAPDQPVQQPDRSDRQHHRQPDQRQHELAGPVHHVALEQPGAGAEENRRPRRTARDCRCASRSGRNSAAGTASPR